MEKKSAPSMSPKSNKRKKISLQERPLVESDPTCAGAFENKSNSEKGLLQLPVELWAEILDNFQKITSFTVPPHELPVLPKIYLERTDVLRALSQVSVAYRWVFQPLLWETFNVCCEARQSSDVRSSRFSNSALEASSVFKHLGGTLVRKCDGFSANPDLRPYVRTVNIVLTRYRSAMVIPRFPALLQSLPNLHTLHILHAHHLDREMLGVLQGSLEGVLLPSIRNLVIPSSCHIVLKCCPNVTTLSFSNEDGHRLVPIIQHHCKSVQELRGFTWNEILIKDIFKAVPNLNAFDMWVKDSQVVLKHLASFKKLNTITIKTPTVSEKYPELMEALQKCIRDTKLRFEALPTTKERKYIHVIYDDKDRRSAWICRYDTPVHELIAYRHTVKNGNVDHILAWSRDTISLPNAYT